MAGGDPGCPCGKKGWFASAVHVAENQAALPTQQKGARLPALPIRWGGSQLTAWLGGGSRREGARKVCALGICCQKLDSSVLVNEEAFPLSFLTTASLPDAEGFALGFAGPIFTCEILSLCIHGIINTYRHLLLASDSSALQAVDSFPSSLLGCKPLTVKREREKNTRTTYNSFLRLSACKWRLLTASVKKGRTKLVVNRFHSSQSRGIKVIWWAGTIMMYQI